MISQIELEYFRQERAILTNLRQMYSDRLNLIIHWIEDIDKKIGENERNIDQR